MGFVLQSLHYEVCIMECRVMDDFSNRFMAVSPVQTHLVQDSCMWVSLCEFAASPSVTEVYS